MILTGFGKLSIAQALTVGSVVSTNIIDLAKLMADGSTVLGVEALKDVWAVVQTEVIGVGNATSTVMASCRIATDVGLATAANNYELAAVTVLAYNEVRIATAGKHIMALNIGKMLQEVLKGDTTHRYLGFYFTLGAGSGTSPTISVNASISPTEPPIGQATQATISGRSANDLSGLIPAVASAGSSTNA